MAQAWGVFLGSVAGSIAIERHRGIDAAREIFVAMVGGTVDPAQGIVIEP